MNCKDCKKRLYPDNPEVGFTNLRTKRYYPPLCQGCGQQGEQTTAALEDRIGNLEAMVAEPGRIPRRYHDYLQQLQGQVVHLQNALYAALDRGKKKAEQQAERQTTHKSTYKGLKVGT